MGARLFLLNMLVQIVGVGVGVYLAITRSLVSAIALVAIISVLHVAITKLSGLLMLVHQKTLSHDELRQLTGYGIPELAVTPPLWRVISNVCGLLFFGLAVGTIWWFLRAT